MNDNVAATGMEASDEERQGQLLEKLREANQRLVLAGLEQERLIREIETQRRLLRAVVDNAPAAIAVLDGQGLRVKLANEAFRQFLDEPHRQVDITGLPIHEIIPEAATCGVLKVFGRVATAGRPLVDAAHEHVGFARGVTYWNWTVLPIPTGESGDLDFMMLVTEVTDHVLARKSTEEVAAQASQRAQELQEYISLISHDLRSPLTALMGQTQMLQRDLVRHGQEREAKSAEFILKSAKRMNGMIQDLVESARLEAGQLELQRQPMDVCHLLSDLLHRIGSLEEQARLRLVPCQGLSLVMADAERVERVLTNLITNALKYSPPETEVLVAARAEKREVVVSVTDWGVGISPESLPHIFERFYRAEGNRRTAGLGLGLYIARMLVEAQQGRIWVESELGKGSSFHFSLPVVSET
ncbi:MAG: ATP-binding protein [Chloroflexi bacterium]|nr:ATP-binding protein [Chloroflexota bacterium]